MSAAASIVNLREPAPWGRRDAWILGGVLVGAGLLRLIGLGGMTLIDDELAHLFFVQRSPGFLYDALFISPHLPVWFLLYKGWAAISQADLWLRGFSLLWGLLAIAALYGAVRQVRGRRAGALAAAVLAGSGFHINFSRTVTPYALLTLLGAAALWSMLGLLARGGRRRVLVHAALLTVALYSHQAGVLLWGAGLAAVGLVLLAGQGDRVQWRPVLAAHGLALVTGLGLIPILLAQWQSVQQVHGISYLPAVTAGVVAERIGMLLAYHWQWSNAGGVMVAVMAAVAAAAAVAMVRRRAADGWVEACLATVWLAPLGLCVLLGVFAHKELFYEARFFALFVPAWAGLAGVVVEGLFRAPGPGLRAGLGRLLAAALLAAVLLPQIGSLASLYGGAMERENFPIQAINAHLDRHARPGDLAVMHSSYYLFFFRHYRRAPWPRFIGAVQEGFQIKPFGGLHDQADTAAVARLRQRLGGQKRVWLLLTPTTNAHLRDPAGLVERDMARRHRTVSEQCFNCESGEPVIVRLLERLP